MDGSANPERAELQFIVVGGYKSDSPYAVIEECPFGYYSEEGNRLCMTCDAPMVCSNPALPEGMQTDCAQLRGYYQELNNQEECIMCEPGFYCPRGTNIRQTCPDGTFALGAAEFCRPCPPGHYCPDVTSPRSEVCPFGFYSPGGQHYCTPCDEDYACDMSGVTDKCPDFQYSDLGDSYCRFWPAGYGYNDQGATQNLKSVSLY